VTSPVNVVIFDRNELVREFVGRACRERGMQVVAEVSTVAECLVAASRHRDVVVVLSDPLTETPIVDPVGQIVGRGAKVVVFSDSPSPEQVIPVLEAGASSYLLYDSRPQDIADAALSVAGGGAVLHSSVASVVLEEWRRLSRVPGPSPASLTPREREVLSALAEGLTTKAIARRLGVAIKTVESHKVRLFNKLGARTQAQAVSIAIGQHLVAADDHHDEHANSDLLSGRSARQ
jgi:DNA-binding NarL/FixJ family response regulator